MALQIGNFYLVCAADALAEFGEMARAISLTEETRHDTQIGGCCRRYRRPGPYVGSGRPGPSGNVAGAGNGARRGHPWG